MSIEQTNTSVKDFGTDFDQFSTDFGFGPIIRDLENQDVRTINWNHPIVVQTSDSEYIERVRTICAKKCRDAGISSDRIWIVTRTYFDQHPEEIKNTVRQNEEKYGRHSSKFYEMEQLRSELLQKALERRRERVQESGETVNQ